MNSYFITGKTMFKVHIKNIRQFFTTNYMSKVKNWNRTSINWMCSKLAVNIYNHHQVRLLLITLNRASALILYFYFWLSPISDRYSISITPGTLACTCNYLHARGFFFILAPFLLTWNKCFACRVGDWSSSNPINIGSKRLIDANWKLIELICMLSHNSRCPTKENLFKVKNKRRIFKILHYVFRPILSRVL